MQAGTSGAGIGFVVGESSYWKWEAGITRSVDADPYNGSYSVTINDKIRGECGIHRIDPSEANAHARQASCPVNITQDGTNVYCTVTGFYKCDPPHIHQFPSGGSGSQPGNGSTPPTGSVPPSNGGCTTTPTLVNCEKRTANGCTGQVSNASEHQETCESSTCSDTYWSCNSSDASKHKLRTCTRTRPHGYIQCGQQWRRCEHNSIVLPGGYSSPRAPRCPKTDHVGFCSDVQ